MNISTKFKSWKLTTVTLFLSFHLIFGQNNLGIPPVINFKKAEYKGGTQTWDIDQDKRGIMYFANNNGLLEYDGSHWQTFEVENKTIVRSVHVAKNGRIYVGAQDEFGYFYPDMKGKLKYTTLTRLLAPKDKIEDVWHIAETDKGIYFQTSTDIFRYYKNSIQKYSSEKGILSMTEVKGNLLVQNKEFELLKIDPELKHSQSLSKLEGEITGYIPLKNDTILISTLKHGFYSLINFRLEKWQTAYDDFLKSEKMYDVTLVSNNQLAIATSKKGTLIMDENRKVIYHFSKFNGLQNNNVLKTFEDREGNIWLGLDNGIDCIFLKSRYTHVIPDRDLQSTGYTAAVFNNKIYLGLSDGVYEAPYKDRYDPLKADHFKKIHHTDGQTWGLQSMENDLLLGHHEGGFILKDGHINTLIKDGGIWTFIPLDSNHLLSGGYNGLNVFEKKSGQWQLLGKVEGLNESCRIMMKDNKNSVWISHPYRGIFRLKWNDSNYLNPRISFYDTKNGLPSNLNNYVFSVRNHAVIGTEYGIYRMNENTNLFEPDIEFNKNLGIKNQRVKYLKEDRNGNLYYITDKEVGKLDITDFAVNKSIKKKVFSKMNSKMVGGFEFIYPYDNIILFGVEHGFILYNEEEVDSTNSSINVILTRVNSSDTDHYNGWFHHKGSLSTIMPSDTTLYFPYQYNSLTFHLTTTNFKDKDVILYRTQLTGSQNEWQEWSDEKKFTFTNLSPGKYVFKYQAMNMDGRMSNEGNFTFIIKAPWYRSVWAYLLYALCCFILLYRYLRRQKEKFNKEKEMLQQQHEEEKEVTLQQVEETKAELDFIKNEKLEDEIKFKNKELALATMHLVQKGEIMQTLKINIQNILDKTQNNEVKKELQTLANLLSFDAQLDEDWEQFAFHFDQVHVDFLNRLRVKYPQLTANDIKLCAYLRMNLNIKETAQMLNISVRGVEASRYRLRKKLNLPNEANLVDFMLRV